MNPLDLIIYIIDKAVKATTHGSSKYVHGRDRRSSPQYLKKRKIVKKIWTVALVIIALLLQVPMYAAFIVVVAMLATFVSFVILDETDDNPN